MIVDCFLINNYKWVSAPVSHSLSTFASETHTGQPQPHPLVTMSSTATPTLSTAPDLPSSPDGWMHDNSPLTSPATTDEDERLMQEALGVLMEAEEEEKAAQAVAMPVVVPVPAPTPAPKPAPAPAVTAQVPHQPQSPTAPQSPAPHRTRTRPAPAPPPIVTAAPHLL